MTKEKQRLDILLVEKGLASSRERAQALIIAGRVLVEDQPITKPGTKVDIQCLLRLRGQEQTYVSRGATKLCAALDAFLILPKGRIALDVGASTGGFTEVLLERGAAQVFAIDVGHNQLDWKIRQDTRVIVREGLNARYLKQEDLGERPSLTTVDVSFISLDKILGPILSVSTQDLDLVTLIKPQFEVGKEKVGKGGIVRSDEDRQMAVTQITTFAESIGLQRIGLIESPIKGTDGNQEFLAHWKRKN